MIKYRDIFMWGGRPMRAVDIGNSYVNGQYYKGQCHPVNRYRPNERVILSNGSIAIIEDVWWNSYYGECEYAVFGTDFMILQKNIVSKWCLSNKIRCTKSVLTHGPTCAIEWRS